MKIKQKKVKPKIFIEAQIFAICTKYGYSNHYDISDTVDYGFPSLPPIKQKRKI